MAQFSWLKKNEADGGHVSTRARRAVQQTNGMSALMNASANGHIAVADRLIAAGAKLDLLDKVSESG